MKNLIIISLLPLLVLSFFSIMLGNEFIRIDIEGVRVFSSPQGSFGSSEGYLNVDPITTSLAVIMVIALACAIIGARIIGSGLAENSVRLLTVGLCYTAIWTFISLLAYPLIRSIQEFGIVIYLVLTVLYTFGVIEKMIGQ